jgi:hypothetical protein
MRRPFRDEGRPTTTPAKIAEAENPWVAISTPVYLLSSSMSGSGQTVIALRATIGRLVMVVGA